MVIFQPRVVARTITVLRMATNRFIVVVLAILVALAQATNPDAQAASFTFDFRYPAGAGSPYTDAISLNTVGALRDRNGHPLGFTRLNMGDADGDGCMAGLELTGAGLQFDASVENAMLGVPFNTTGNGQDLGGDIRMVAVLENIQGLDKAWEQIAVGWGFGHTTGAHTNFSGARIMADPIPRYTILSPPTSRSETGSIPDQNISVRKWSNSPLRFYGVFDTGGTSINDNYNLLNMSSSVYGVFGVNKTSGGDGFTGRLVAIRYFGENLEIPLIQKPKGTVVVFH